MTQRALIPEVVDDIASEQCRYYSSAIGRGVEKAIIEDLRAFAQCAPIHERFNQYAEIRFVYEMLSMGGGFEKVLALVDSWVNNEHNVNRAARHVNRKPTVTGQALVRAFCVFRLKALDGPQWEFLDDHGAYNDGDARDPRPQTVVFISLTHLSQQNGFFIDLEPGQDVCVDSVAGLMFPPEGGGLGVCLCLNL